ncbi:MAG: phosphohydrolase, partial [Streptosporangiaceae bacterium]
MAIREADDRLPSWQAMDSGRLLLLAAVGMMVVAAVAHTAAARLTEPQTAVAFGSVIAIGELLRLRQQGGREAAPVATAAALAYALLLR